VHSARSRRATLLLLALAAAAWATAALVPARSDAVAADGGWRPTPPAECVSCHVDACERWRLSAHALSTRPAVEGVVPFEVAAERKVTHPPGSSAFRRTDGGFETETAGDDGAPHRWPLEIVVGGRRMKMLAARMDDGRLQILPAMREEPGGAWFDYTQLLFGTTPGTAPTVRPGEPSFWTGPDRSFDARCARCHLSGYEPREPAPAADGALRGPRSAWRTLGIDCRSCHGDGEAHVVHWRKPPEKRTTDPILRLGTMDRERGLAVCMPCHLEGEVIDPKGPQDDPLAWIEPTLLDDVVRVDPAARPLELMYESLAFLTSRCATTGKLTCLQCHSVHGSAETFSLKRPLERDAEFCVPCHADLASKAPEHAHHKAGGSGVRCTLCHMPAVTVERGHGAVTDHTLGSPRLPTDAETKAAAEGRPERATDACTWCHTRGRRAPRDAPVLDAAKLRDAYAQWWPAATPDPSWTAAIDGGRRGDDAALEDLAALARDGTSPRLLRASAARLLGNFPEEGETTLLSLAGDRDSLVRRAALRALASVRSEGADAELLAAMKDASPSVRIVAARAALQGWARVRASKALLAAALPVLEEDARLVPDDHLRWFRLGAARQIAGDVAGAIAAYERKLALDPNAKAVRETVARLRK
jgi:predicted CXXCH cytochrome family protein